MSFLIYLFKTALVFLFQCHEPSAVPSGTSRGLQTPILENPVIETTKERVMQAAVS